MPISMKNIGLIKRLDVSGMQEVLEKDRLTVNRPNKELCVFKEKAEYQDYLKNINLSVFLGAPACWKIKCPFCGEAEGYIDYYEDEEVWTYRCFHEEKSHNIVGMVQAIALCRYSQAMEFINQVYRVAYVPEAALQATIENNIQILADPSFGEQYPWIVRYLGTYLPLTVRFFTALRTMHNASLHTRAGEAVVALTTAEVQQMLGISGGKARTFLRWIVLLGYLDAVRMEELDAISQSRLSSMSDFGRYEYASVFRINRLDDVLLGICEETARDLKALRLTKGNMTLKTIRAITSGEADDYRVVSPNYSQWRRNSANGASMEAIARYGHILQQAIDKRGYLLEKELPEKVRLKRMSTSSGRYVIPVAWREVRSAVLQECDCKSIPANKDILRCLGIEEPLSGNIIIPTDAVYSVEDAVGAVLNEIAANGYAVLKEHLPVSKQSRKEFRDMLSACGIKSVRLNDTYRKRYGICDVKGCIDILIDANDIQNKDKA